MRRLANGTFRRFLRLSGCYNEFLQADAGRADVLHGTETAGDLDRPGSVLWRCELCRTQVYPTATLGTGDARDWPTDGRTGLKRGNHLNLSVNLVNAENELPRTSSIWKLISVVCFCFVLLFPLTCNNFSFEIVPMFSAKFQHNVTNLGVNFKQLRF